LKNKKKKSNREKRHLAQIARRKNLTKVKPSGKIYRRKKKLNDIIDE